MRKSVLCPQISRFPNNGAHNALAKKINKIIEEAQQENVRQQNAFHKSEGMRSVGK